VSGGMSGGEYVRIPLMQSQLPVRAGVPGYSSCSIVELPMPGAGEFIRCLVLHFLTEHESVIYLQLFAIDGAVNVF